jgi:hypothetical protein
MELDWRSTSKLQIALSSWASKLTRIGILSQIVGYFFTIPYKIPDRVTAGRVIGVLYIFLNTKIHDKDRILHEV